MKAAMVVLRGLSALNATLLKLGRAIGCVAVALMVVAILIQVFFRYVLNNALPWPDEAARFCMLWMTGLMAPTAFRTGGFVAIDMVSVALPRKFANLLGVLLLCISLLVLVIALQIGWKEITGIGGRFATASLYVPLNLSFSDWYRVPRSWMMLSLLIGVGLLTLVNIELLLRNLVGLFGRGGDLPPLEKAARAD